MRLLKQAGNDRNWLGSIKAEYIHLVVLVPECDRTQLMLERSGRSAAITSTSTITGILVFVLLIYI